MSTKRKAVVGETVIFHIGDDVPAIITNIVSEKVLDLTFSCGGKTAGTASNISMGRKVFHWSFK